MGCMITAYHVWSMKYNVQCTMYNVQCMMYKYNVWHNLTFQVLSITYFSQLNLKTWFTISVWSSYCCLHRELDPGAWNSKVFNQLKTYYVFSHACCICTLQTSKNMIHGNCSQTKSFHLRTVKPCQMRQFYIPCTEKFTLRAWPAGAWRYSRLKTGHILCTECGVHTYA